jgi:hypothetical protein
LKHFWKPSCITLEQHNLKRHLNLHCILELTALCPVLYMKI